MGARSENHRGDGIDFPVMPPAGAYTVTVPADFRLRSAVIVSPAGGTIDFKVGGVSVRAQSDAPTGVVGAASRTIVHFSNVPIIAQGTDIQVTTTDGTARISLGLARA